MNPAQYGEVWRYIKDIKVAMLTSHDNGQLRARPMMLSQDKFDGTLWFFSRRNSHKTGEVTADPAVNLSFVEPKNDIYLSISGTARVVRDQQLIDRLWNQMVAAWFPEGKDSPEVVLLEVEVQAAEVWDSHESVMKQLYDMVRARIKDEKPDMGTHHRYN